MGLFILIVVGLVVALTWLDWRETRRVWAIPEWARGAALAGVLAVSLASATSFASAWIEGSASPWPAALGSRFFWPEAAFALGMMAVIVLAARKKRLRIVLLLAACCAAAFGLGMLLSS